MKKGGELDKNKFSFGKHATRVQMGEIKKSIIDFHF